MPIAHFAVNRRVAVTMIALAIVVLGIFAVPRLPIALLPSFTPPVVSVSVSYPNVGPAQMETLVTRPIENAVSRVSGVQLIDSTSAEGSTEVRATFYYGTNIDTAAVDVQEQVDRVRGQLPNDPNLQQPQIAKFDSNSLPVVRMFVTDPNMTQRDLGDLYTNVLADEFSSVSGVASVSVNSDQNRAIMVQPNSNLLAANGLTLAQLSSRISNENINLPAGIIQQGNMEYQVRSSALLTSAQQVGDIVVATKNGSPIRLSDVASVSDSNQEQREFQRLNGTPAVGVTITAQPNANIVATAVGIYAKMADVQKRYPGMNFGITLDQRGFIQEAINALEHTAIYGAVLAILIIFLFLHSWRSTLVVAISLPISVLGTLFVAYTLGYSLNIMTLGGLALAVGLIVDDAIVVIENIFRHMAMGQNVKQAAENATAEIFSAVLASSTTVITVFIPLVLIPGLQGLLFTPFAIMVMSAVAFSFLVAVTTVPMLVTVLMGNRPSAHTGHATLNGNGSGTSRSGYARFVAGFDRSFDRFSDWYKRTLSHAVDRPGLVMSIAGAIFVVSLLFLKLGFVQTELFPASNSNFIRFNLRMPTGTALNVMDAVTKDVERRMLKDRYDPKTGKGEVVALGVQVGSDGSNSSNLSIEMPPSTTSAQAAAFTTRWQAALTGNRAGARGRGAKSVSNADAARYRELYGSPIPGLRAFGRTTDIVQSIIARGQDALQIQIYGPNINTLYNLAQYKAIPLLEQIPGLQPPSASVTDSQPELDISVNRARAAQLGLDTTTVAQTIDTATAGSIASYMQLNATQYPIVVQLPADQRRSLQSIEALNIPISAPSLTSNALVSAPTAVAGSVPTQTLPTVPLGEVADISFGKGPSEIPRENKQREINVNAGLNIPLGEAVTAATAIMNSIPLPAGYHWQYGQAVTQQSDTFGSLIVIVILAILLIYMLLASQFESIVHPLVIMMAVPLSLAGIVMALFLTQRAFGLTAFIGVLMLVGIVVKNAILVVEFTNQLRDRGMSPRDAVLHAAPLRLRPILMTTLATIGGMLPIALGLEAGSETQAPLGTVVIGGLLVSTMLSLIVVPTLYLWSAKHVEPRMGSFHGSRKPQERAVPPEPEPLPAH
ncbi:MAG TPA: efflux RND transporter permease subunit [Candidatus Baltobacteraceae bacterium]